MTSPRASLYVRLSRASDERNLSRQGMTEDLRKLCADRGFTVIDVHVDDGRSGAIRDRKAFRAWLADATEGRADVLAAWHVDRLSREGLNVAAMILDVIEGKDPETGKVVRPPVRLIGYDDRLDSADGEGFRLNFVIKAELARAELSRIRQRSQARVRRLRAEKRSTGGLTPYGYQRARRGQFELEHDPVSAPILREVVERVVAGAPVASVAKDLNTRGVLSPRDHSAMRETGEPRKHKDTGEALPPQRWTDETLKRILINPVLLGRLTDNGLVIRNADGSPVMRGEPLISETDWNALQLAIEGRKRPKVRAAPRSLLSGVGFCAYCGAPLHFHWAVRPNRGQEYTYYRCSGRTRRGNGCDARAPWAETVDRLVAEMLLNAVGGLDVMRKVFVPGDDTASELADVEERMRELRGDRQAGLYRGEKGTAEFREMYGALEERRESLTHLPSRPDRWAYVSTGQTYRGLWESSDTAGRRKLLHEAGVRVEAVKGTGLGLYDRPEGFPALSIAQDEENTVGLYLPVDLAERASKNPAVRPAIRAA